MNVIGTRIRKLRDEKGISQETMAIELSLSQSNYGRLEKDDKRLTAPKLQKIAAILKTSISYLFHEQTSKEIHPDNSENLNQNNKQVTNKLIEQYECRLKEKDDMIAFLKKL